MRYPLLLWVIRAHVSTVEWKDFSIHYDFWHITSYKSTVSSVQCKAEKEVHILKQLPKKAADSNSESYLDLFTYRASPLQCGLSAAELLMNRKLQITLACQLGAMLGQKLMQMKLKQKSLYGPSSKHLEPLSRNDVVMIEGPNTWNRKAIVLQEVAPRSYSVRTDDGHILRQKRRFRKWIFTHIRSTWPNLSFF